MPHQTERDRDFHAEIVVVFILDTLAMFRILGCTAAARYV